MIMEQGRKLRYMSGLILSSLKLIRPDNLRLNIILFKIASSTLTLPNN